MKNIIKAFLVLFTFISCEGEKVDVNHLINDNSSSIKYIIEGTITNYPSKHHIIISKPSTLNSQSGIQGVSGAVVTVSDGIRTWNYSELPLQNEAYHQVYNNINPAIYESDEYFIGVEGNTYTLEVVIEGITYNAQETMPIASAATETELSIVKNTSSNSIFGQKKSSIWLKNESDRESLSSKLFFSNTVNINFFDRIEPEGILGADGSFDSGFFVEYTSVIRKNSITDKFSDYLWAFLSESEWQDTPFTTEPGKLPTFFNTPEVSGFFSAISGKSYDFDGTSLTLRTIRLFEEQSSYSATYNESEFTVSFSSTGRCSLHGFNQSMVGAYEILNNQWVIMHFSDKYNNDESSSAELYEFYKLRIQGATLVDTDPNFYEGELPGFEYENDTSLKSEDGVVWE